MSTQSYIKVPSFNIHESELAEPIIQQGHDIGSDPGESAGPEPEIADQPPQGAAISCRLQDAALRAYLPPQVADQIAANDGSLELGGVLQMVTVLFADIRGFTQLSEKMDAQDVVLMLNEFFTAMTEVVLEAGGTVDKYIGDCVMALFGAPTQRSDDVERGVCAAINMQRVVARMNVDRLQRGLKALKIGVGLHVGPAVVGNIGCYRRMQYTAIGDTINVASRVVGTAAPEQVLVSGDVRSAVPNGWTFQHLGKVELKGRQQKLNIYSVPWETV